MPPPNVKIAINNAIFVTVNLAEFIKGQASIIPLSVFKSVSIRDRTCNRALRIIYRICHLQ